MFHPRIGIILIHDSILRSPLLQLAGLIMRRERCSDPASGAHSMTIRVTPHAIDVLESDVIIAGELPSPYEFDLQEILMIEKAAEECILPERDPLPRAPKRIRPKARIVIRPIMRRSVPRGR